MSDIYKKSEVIADVSEKTNMSRDDVSKVIDAYHEAAQTAICEGKTVRLENIGSIIPVDKEARTARNPQTGESIQVPAKKAVKFSASQALKTAQNS